MKKTILILSILILAGCVKDRRPSAPTNLLAMWSELDQNVRLHWQDNSFNEDYFKIVKNGIVDTTVTVNFYADNDIQQNEKYQYQVWAVNEYGAKESNIASITIPGPPSAVLNFSAEPEFHKVRLNWDFLESADSYVIVRDNEQIAIVAAETTVFLDTTVQIWTEYIYIVYGKNENGLGVGNMILTKTRGRFLAIWNRSKDYIDGDVENGFATGYRLYLLGGEEREMIYDGPDTSYAFLVDFLPCVVVQAYDEAGNVSEDSEVECIPE